MMMLAAVHERRGPSKMAAQSNIGSGGGSLNCSKPVCRLESVWFDRIVDGNVQ